MRALSLKHGYDKTAVSGATRQQWPAVEKIIAEFLGVSPQTIWPDRYSPDGQPKYLRQRGKVIHTPDLRKNNNKRAA